MVLSSGAIPDDSKRTLLILVNQFLRCNSSKIRGIKSNKPIKIKTHIL